MKKWIDRYRIFVKDRLYLLMLTITAVCSYGFLITHHTVGIDDTPSLLYFEEGMAAIVGRWVCFLLNKVLHLAEFAPFLTDFMGMLLFVAAVTVWCGLFYAIFGERIPRYGYRFFSCIFLSCPLISEVFVYYLHNAVALGYLLSGISLCCFLEGISRKEKRVQPFVGSAVCLWVALGCYESFMIVWLVGVCLLLMAKRMCGEKTGVSASGDKSGKRGSVPVDVGIAGSIALCAMVLRSVMIAGVTEIFSLEYLQGQAVQRSVTEMISWLLEPGAAGELAMVLKRIYVLYGVFACAYYPIFVFVLAAVIIGAAGILMGARRKDLWIPVLALASFGAAFALALVEGKATYYRSAQFVPLICAFGLLLSVWGVSALADWIARSWGAGQQTAASAEGLGRRIPGLCHGLVGLALSAILWNQCVDMNRWFYVDWLKYQAAEETVSQIAYELEKNFDVTKPVAFVGSYEIPASIVQDAYVSYSSQEYTRMIKLTNWLDDVLLEKYYRPAGVWVAQQPTLSVIEWGLGAFGNQQELFRFFSMHGYTFQSVTEEVYLEAQQYAEVLPEFPAAGSIVDAGEYIVVNF